VLAQAPGHQGDIFKSQDGGATWTVFPTGMDGFSFVFDPNDPDTIYGISPKRLEARLQPPYIRNLAGRSTLSPGLLFSIYGEDLADAVVTFNGERARLQFSSPGQINGQVPVGLRGKDAIVEIIRGSGRMIDRQSIALSPAAPVILQDASGVPRLYHLDGGRPVTVGEAARNPRWIIAYCTGLGEGTPLSVQFLPAEREASPAQVKFVSPVPEQDGVYQVAIYLPASLPPGSYVLLFSGGQNFAHVEIR
jgi:uncharacterized protein (TIGR03437 family)